MFSFLFSCVCRIQFLIFLPVLGFWRHLKNATECITIIVYLLLSLNFFTKFCGQHRDAEHNVVAMFEPKVFILNPAPGFQ